jgi:hypothetical protein
MSLAFGGSWEPVEDDGSRDGAREVVAGVLVRGYSVSRLVAERRSW